MKAFYPTLVICALAGPVSADVVGDCDGWITQAYSLAEPWENNTRVFAEGAVRIAIIDTLEPAAAAFHLMILSPPYSEIGDRQCQLVSAGDGLGFAGLSLDDMTTHYDESVGLVFQLTQTVFDVENSEFYPAPLTITLNQSTGDVGVFSD